MVAPNATNKFGCLGVVTGLILFATLGWGLLCYDAGFTEYQRLCEEGKGHIRKRIPKIASYVDASSTGCSYKCLQDLRAQIVSFVELDAGRPGDAAQHEFWKRNEIVSPPSAIGKYQVRIRAEDPLCQSLIGVSPSYDRSLAESCLAFQAVAEFVSRYEFKETWVQKSYSMGNLTGIFTEYRDRGTGEVIATRGGYGYQGVAARILPLTYQQSCGTSFFHFPELVQGRGAH